MESPNGDPIKAPPSSSSSSTPASSPTHHSVLSVSPFSNFLINLSPINSVKATRYTQRFSEIHIPTPPVFRTPRLDLQRETSFLESDKVDEAGSDVHGQCGNGANAILVTCLAKEVQFCSPSVCIEEYLTDHMEVEDCPNSASSHVQQANNFTEENIPRVNDANDGNSKDCRLLLPYQARPNLTLRSMDLVETAVDERDAERFDGSSELRFNNVNDQNAGDQLNQQSSSCQLPKSFQTIESYKDCLESSGSFKQCGTRRHLQFEAAMACKSTANLKSHSSHNITEEADNIKIPVSVTDLESLTTFNVESRGVSNHRQAISSDRSIDSWTSFCPSEFIRSTPHGGTLAISGPIPSGTGLHINNISRSVPMGSDPILSKNLAGYMNSQEEKLNPGLSNDLAKSLNSCFISSAAGELHAHVDNYEQDNQGVEDISSDIFQSTDSMKPPCNYLHATFSEQQSAPSEGGMHTSESIDMAEELNQVSPKKKRKRAALSSEGEGCKHCNCKRSKCLKLYCECFAAGVYCVDSCACESCYNKIEYEDTVQDIRKQIENRNPTAFAPKIVNHASDSPANVLEDGNWATPASARHKRGCNCKKSKCLKKYCECYQAKVGCSDACRCEGCNNSFGKKAELMYQRAERWKNPSHCKLDTTETDTDRTKAGTVKQFSQRWEEFAAISHITPLSQSYSVAEAPSVSPSTRDCPKVFQAQLHPGSSLTSSASHICWGHSPMSLTPQFSEDKDAHKLAPENAFTEIRKDNDMPEILKNNTTPTKAIKASSPNKKRVSPPQFPSHELMSSSSPGLQSGRKFVWQDVPSFPPLSPYSKSKEGITPMETDLKPDTQ